LPVAYSSSNSLVAVISGGLIRITGAGTAVITATQAGDEDYEPAAGVTRTLVIGKADQSVTFPSLDPVNYGDPAVTPGATASSGLDVIYTSSHPLVASVSGNLIIINSVGT